MGPDSTTASGSTEGTHDLREIPPEECMDLLHSRQIGRLAVHTADGPYCVPVNYLVAADPTGAGSAVGHEVIVFRTDEGTKLAGSALATVAFEVDDMDPASQRGWSVMVRGVANDITDALDPLAVELRTLPVHPWASGPKPRWVMIRPRSITGRRVHARP